MVCVIYPLMKSVGAHELRYAFRPIFILDWALNNVSVGEHLLVQRDHFEDSSGVIYDLSHSYSNRPILNDPLSYSIPVLGCRRDEGDFEKSIRDIFEEFGFQRFLVPSCLSDTSSNSFPYDLYDVQISPGGEFVELNQQPYLVGVLGELRRDLTWRRLLKGLDPNILQAAHSNPLSK